MLLFSCLVINFVCDFFLCLFYLYVAIKSRLRMTIAVNIIQNLISTSEE